MCKHENTTTYRDHIQCNACYAIKTDSMWGLASNTWFKDITEAKFYEKNGKYPETIRELVSQEPVDPVVIYAYYADEGPSGMCGQSMAITCKWRKLHIFNNYEAFRRWAEKLASVRGRLRPRIEHYWISDGLSDDIIKHI